MKALILGGTGTMGLHLVCLLAEQGYDVSVTSRSRFGRDGNIQYITGDALDDSFFDGLLRDHWDVIVDFMVYSTDAFRSRYKKLLNAAGHYLYLSSSRVYAGSNSPITESSPRLLDTIKDKAYLATDEYALSKARQENLLFDSLSKNWSVLRPYITYGDERLQIGVLEKEAWLYRALRGRSIVIPREVQSKTTTLTFGGDVARSIAALVGQKNAYGEAFHITSSQSIRWENVLDIYLKVLGQHLEVGPNVVLQELDVFEKHHANKYQISYDRLYNRIFDNSKIGEYIDTGSFVSPDAGLSDCLSRFLTRNDQFFHKINWRTEAIKDRLTSERTPLREIADPKSAIKYIFFRYTKKF